MIRAFLLVLLLVSPAASVPLATDELTDYHFGELPLVLVAPHGGWEKPLRVSERHRSDKPQFNKKGDLQTHDLTLRLATELHRLTGRWPSLVLARFHRKYVDPNRSADQAYDDEDARVFYEGFHALIREAVVRTRAQHGAGLLLDIHGQSSHPADLMLGTRNGKSLSAATRDWLYRMAHGLPGYQVQPASPQQPEELAGGYIVRTYGLQNPLGLEAVQLEHGAALRKTEESRQAYAEALAAELAGWRP